MVVVVAVVRLVVKVETNGIEGVTGEAITVVSPAGILEGLGATDDVGAGVSAVVFAIFEISSPAAASTFSE